MSAIHLGSRISIVSRLLAAVLLGLFVLAFWPVDGAPPAAINWFLLPLMLSVMAAFAVALVTGREPPVVICDPLSLLRWIAGRHPERAARAEVARLRRLGLRAGWRTSVGEARRLIGLAEGRLPPTLVQQRELARYRPQRPVVTRASAARFLAERAAEEALAEVEAWAEGWVEAGVEIQYPLALTPRERAAFDAAAAALFGAGIPYPLPARLSAFDIVAETARMQLAMEMPGWLDAAQRLLSENGFLRRPLHAEELREFLPGVVEAWRREPEFEFGALLLYVVARDRPALLTDPWAARAFVTAVSEALEAGGPA